MLTFYDEFIARQAAAFNRSIREYTNLHAGLVKLGYTDETIVQQFSPSGNGIIIFFQFDLDKEEFYSRLADIERVMGYSEPSRVHDAGNVKAIIADYWFDGIEVSFWLQENAKCEWVETGEVETKKVMKNNCS